MSIERLVSHATEASVLGCAVTSDNKREAIVEILPCSDYFHNRKHRLVYDAILALHNDGEPVELITVCDKLGEEGLKKVGGRTFVSGLTIDYDTSKSAVAHAQIVARKYRLRQIGRMGQEVTEKCHADGADPAEIIEQWDKDLLELTDVSHDDVRHIVDEAPAYAAKLLGEVPVSSDEALVTRIDYLNQQLGGGLRRGHMVVIGGSPSMGKTSLALDTILYNANYGRRSLIFTIDELIDDVVRRSFALNLGFDPKRMYDRGPWSSEEKARIEQTRDALKNHPWSIVEASGMTAMAIRSRARAYKRRHGQLDIIMIDYIGLIRPSKRTGQSREREVADISSVLKEMAKELNCCVLAISQLNRSNNNEQLLHIHDRDRRQVPRPRMSMLRDSGSIEADANVVILPFMPSELLRERLGEDHEWTEEARGNLDGIIPAEIIVAKNKMGPKCKIDCQFDQRRMRFFQLAPQPDPELGLVTSSIEEAMPF